MKNFEKMPEKNQEKIDKDIFNKLNHEVENYIVSKANKFIVIIENSDFNINKAEIKLEKKIDTLKDEIKTKFFSTNFLEEINNILKRKILKITLEMMAEKKLDNTLSFYKNLEDKYFTVLLEEAKYYWKNNQSFDSIKDLIKFLNQKKVLDNNLQGDLINNLEKEKAI